jgi:hypothetical protein|tara:strand:- start:42 stop:896 length:855 start_codon:yes stop_codon:yes gene_type:complete
MSFTYTTLKTAIKDYTDNDEAGFVRNLPLFIEMTEERILKNVQLSVFQRNAAGVMSSGNEFLKAPSDFLAPFSLSATVGSKKVFLLFKDLDFVQTYTPNPATTGEPIYYAQFDEENFIIGPTPNGDYVVELAYFYRPTSITKSTFLLTMTSVSGTFTTSDTITGSTSGQSTTVTSVNSSTVLSVPIPSGSFTVGETITGSSSGATGVLSAIGEDVTTSFLSDDGRMTLLYGCLSEAYTYMKGDANLMTLYEGRFREGLARLKNLGEGQEIADEYRYGPIRKART